TCVRSSARWVRGTVEGPAPSRLSSGHPVASMSSPATTAPARTPTATSELGRNTADSRTEAEMAKKVSDAEMRPSVNGQEAGVTEGFDRERIERAVREILLAIGEDPDRDGLVETPARVARFYEEVCAGLREDPSAHVRKVFDADHDEMVMVRDIPMYSMCEHHLVPFIGKAHVAYIPSEHGHITGLSKIGRLVDGYARRPQVQ